MLIFWVISIVSILRRNISLPRHDNDDEINLRSMFNCLRKEIKMKHHQKIKLYHCSCSFIRIKKPFFVSINLWKVCLHANMVLDTKVASLIS